MHLFYFPSFYPSDRPDEKWLGAFTHRQVKALRECGVNVEVVLPIPGYPPWPLWLLTRKWRENRVKAYPKERIYDGIKINHPRVPTMRPARIFGPYHRHYKLKVTRFLGEKIRNKEEVFLFAQWLPEAGMVVEVARQQGIPIAILGIGDDILKIPFVSQKHFVAFKKCWVNADIRSVVADYLGKAANKAIGSNLPYEVFYSSVNTDEFFPLPPDEKLRLKKTLKLDNDRLIIVCVGSAILRKGWLDLFDALKEIDNSDFLLLGINGGQRNLNLAEEARQRGLSSRFWDMGEIPADEIYKYYQASDVFCLPSHWEGLANAVLEAMAAGLPIVTTNVSGHPEVIRNEENGFLIEVGDIRQLRVYLEKLMRDPGLRDRIGNAARQAVATLPGSHRQTAKKIVAVLKTFKKC